MQFKLGGIMWEIEHSLRRVDSKKTELKVKDMNEIVSYLEKYHRHVDKDKIEIAVWADRQHLDGKSG